MCGFIFRKSNTLQGAVGLLKHRGPDEQSYIVGVGFELEFSRLTITGTLDGAVPVYSSNEDWLVAFNGEIYNFMELIHSYSLPFTNSDTKVIANGLARFGISFLSKLRGMYAGVAINLKSNSMYIFRDPLGEKPLYYSYENDELVLASEFSALLKMLHRPLQLNRYALSNYLRFGYVEEPWTFDEKIHSVQRGCVLEIGNDSKLHDVMPILGYDEQELSLKLPELLEILNQEVSFSTVPTGLALSAGVDSTSLLYAMSKYRDAPFVPLIINIENSELSTEAVEAIKSCDALGIKPHIIQPTRTEELLSQLKALSIANDQPHADPSGLSYYSIFQAAHSLKLKVVLLGHGPDELFWGYPWFNSKLLKSNDISSQGNLRHYWDTPGMTARLLWLSAEGRRNSLSPVTTDPFLSSANPWHRFRAEIVHSYLASNGLRQSDRLAMSFGVEPRTPYADSRLYGWAQHNSDKNPTVFDKREFRRAVELGNLEAARFRKKAGFASPMGKWFKQSEINDFAGDCLNVILNQSLEWRFKPRFGFLSPSEKYRILMLGSWLTQFA